MRLSQTVLTALVATTATALPVTEKQPQVGTGQQQQQVSPDHDRIQAQKLGGLEESARKQPLGFTDKEISPRSNGKQWDNVEAEKKNPGSVNELFTTNDREKEALGWSSIKSALSRGGMDQGNKYLLGGNRQSGNANFDRNSGYSAGIQARHTPEMSLSGEEYYGQHPSRPFNGEYMAPRELKTGNGGVQKVDMTMPMANTNPEREEWMREPGNGEWVRHGDERMMFKSHGEHQGQHELFKTSPTTESWNSHYPDQQEQQIQGNTHTKDERMVPNRVPFTYDYKTNPLWDQELQKDRGQFNEYLSKSQPINQHSEQYFDHQPSTGQAKEFYVKDKAGQADFSGGYMYTANDMMKGSHIQEQYQKVPLTEKMQKNSRAEGESQFNPIQGEYQENPMWRENYHRGSPNAKELLSTQPILQDTQKDSYYHQGEFQTSPSMKGEYQKTQPMAQRMQKGQYYQGEFQKTEPSSQNMEKNPHLEGEFFQTTPFAQGEYQKTQPMTQNLEKGQYQQGELYQTAPSAKGEYQKTQPMTQNLEKGQYYQGELYQTAPFAKGEYQKTKPMTQNFLEKGQYYQGEFQKTQPTWQETEHRGSPVKVERRNRHLSHVNEMFYKDKPAHSDNEYILPQALKQGENSQTEKNLFNKGIMPTHENMIKTGPTLETRGMIESNEQGRHVPMHGESACNAHHGDMCEATVPNKGSGHDTGVFRLSQRPGRTQEELVLDN